MYSRKDAPNKDKSSSTKKINDALQDDKKPEPISPPEPTSSKDSLLDIATKTMNHLGFSIYDPRFAFELDDDAEDAPSSECNNSLHQK